MHQRVAENLRDVLEPLLPEFEVTAVPWAESKPEWIVTVWDDDGDPLVDVFGVGDGYVLRRPGLGPLVGPATTVADIAALVRPDPEPTVHVFNADGSEADIVARTKTGKVLTEQDFERLADEAERGWSP